MTVRFPVTSGREIDRHLDLRAEVAVIGSGAGGAVLAKELAEKGFDVLVLEQGPYFTADDMNASPMEMARKMYADGGMTVALGNPGLPIPYAKAIGGTTVINSGTCFRLPPAALEKWRRSSGVPLDGAQLSRAFDRVEEVLHVAPAEWDLIGRVAHRVAKGARALGLHPKPLRRNATGCLGCGVCAFGCQKDAKTAMHVSYLPRAAAAGARIYSDARVDRLAVRGGRVSGVEGRFRGRWGRHTRFRVRAPIVALCGGALASPTFLRANGIRGEGGDAGKHLVLHPATKAVGVFDENLVPWEGIPQSMYIDDLQDQGILFEGASVPPDFGSIGVPLFGDAHAEMMSRYGNLGIFGLMVSDSSEGRVVSAFGRPLPLYTVGGADARKALRGLALLADMFFEAGAKEVLAPIAGLERLRSRDDVARLREAAPRIHPNRIEFIAFHPTGTCRMGADPKRSVVDGWLECHELGGLFVVDGSVFPSSPGVNPQETIMGLATRTADRLVDRRSQYV